MATKEFLRNYWPAITIGVTAAAIALAAIVMLSNMPPRMILMATGPEGGAYYELGKRYRAELANEGVDVRLVPTAGSLENRALLLDQHSGVSVALIQGGTMRAGDGSELVSLGTLYYEPLWWFRRREIQVEGVSGLVGTKLSIGPEGSGTRALSLELIKAAGLDKQVGELLALPLEAAGEKLLAGQIDAVSMVASWDAPDVQQLLGDERVTLTGYQRANALIARYPFLSKVVVPRGVRDLAKDLPPTDVTLIAVKANLIVRNDLHSAIQYLLLSAAEHIHSPPGIFQRANEFPSGEAAEIALSNEALRFYKSGPPLLHNYLPFWIAELTGKLIILLIPILGVLYPMTQFLPRLYDWAMRAKVLRLYGELRFLEDEIEDARRTKCGTSEMIARLDRLEEQANRVKLPVAYANMLYSLRDHIDLVREQLRRQSAE
jgi:TRAP transporter TAXI family solute receptor